MTQLEGLLTAMVTAFTPDGAVDEDGTVAVARHLLANGSDGLVVCGTTGEAATLDDAEHLRVIELIVGECGDDGLIVGGVGSNDTRHAIHLTERAAELGCDALLSVTPYYNRPNERGIKLHFQAVAEAAGEVPVIVYNVPTRTGMNMGPDLLAELAQVDGIAGLKQSNNDEFALVDGLAVFAGNDDILAHAMDLGAAGGICVATHLVGNEMKQLMEQPDRRAAIDAELQAVYAACFCTNSPAPTKAGLRLLGVDAGPVRLPLAECDEAELDVVRRALAGVGALTS